MSSAKLLRGGIRMLSAGGEAKVANPNRPFTPPGLPLVGVLPALLRDPLGFCASAAKSSDGIVRLDLRLGELYLVTAPEYVKHILLDNHRNYWKGPMNHRAKFLLGEGLVTSDGEVWRRQRRLIQPAFHAQRLRTLADIVTSSATAMLARWDARFGTREPFDLAQETQALTMDIAVRSFLGAGVPDDHARIIGEAVTLALRHLQLRFFTYFLPEYVPLPGRRRVDAALDRAEGIISELIRNRGEESEEADDLLSLLRSAGRHRGNECTSPQQIHDQIITMLVAGGEAPGLALAWTLYLIARHPDVETAIVTEIRDALGGRLPTFGDLERLPFAKMVVQESLRHYPPVWMFFRMAHGEDELGRYRLPAGSLVALSPYATHHDPRVWADPETFRPERFASAARPAQNLFAYFPFGGGPRGCIGSELALMEVQLVLATLLSSVRFVLAGDQPIVPEAAASLKPRRGIPVTMRYRKAGG